MLLTPSATTLLTIPRNTILTLDLSLIYEGTDPVTGYIYSVELQDAEGGWLATPDTLRLEPIGAFVVRIIPEDGWEGFGPGTDPESPVVAQLRLVSQGRVVTLGIVATPDGPDATTSGTDGDDVLVLTDTNPEDNRLLGLNGGLGDDTLSVESGVGELDGGEGDDILTGGTGDDALTGGAGNDRLYGRGGLDRMLGGLGNDRLFGNDGNDYLDGGAGNDLLAAGLGDDLLMAGQGRDTLRGEGGNDRFELLRATRPVDAGDLAHTLAYGGQGDDRFEIGDRFTEVTDATVGYATLHGGAGNDRMIVSNLDGGALYGGIGNDVITAYTNATGEGTSQIFGGAGDDTLGGLRNGNIRGGSGNDEIGLSSGSTGWGESGNDRITADSLMGMDGDAVLIYGGGGDDTLRGWFENDTVHGGDDNDHISETAGDNLLYGGSGNDTIEGGRNGSDWISGGIGDDLLSDKQYGGSGLAQGQDTIMGGEGNDTITAYTQGHMLYGGSGDDLLYVALEEAQDRSSTSLDGGIGNDTFQIVGSASVVTGDGRDVVTADFLPLIQTHIVVEDFVRGEDVIDVLFYAYGDTRSIGNMLFITDGEGPSGYVGNTFASMVWEADANGVLVSFDADGNATTDGTIYLVGLQDLQSQDLNILV